MGSCEDGLDNDSDGWVDEHDPDCTHGTAEDNSAFGSTACNDATDNDFDGLSDADDPQCVSGQDDNEEV